MKYDILTIGYPMHEVIRQERQGGFPDIGSYLGPFPSGDTCIMLDAAARLGRKCCLIGAGGGDAFAEVVPNRLTQDGVDVSLLRKVEEGSSIVVLVRYDEAGKREYLNFMDQRVLDGLKPDMIPPEVVAESQWIHFSGEIISLCQTGGRREGLLKALRAVSPCSKVSLDPNFTVAVEDMAAVVGPFLERADLVLPSEGEAGLLLGTATDEEACRAMMRQGKTVALKKGKSGCDIYDKDRVIHVDGCRVEEVDPTGCGDSFCAGFLTGMLEGWDLEQTGRFANAAGALAASQMGPMEGVSGFAEVMHFMETQYKEKKTW